MPLIRSRNRRRALRKQRTGAAAVEMALVAPFVFFLFFSSIEFSRMMMVRHALTNAAREGCRKATLVTTRNSDQADTEIRDRLAAVVTGAEKPDIVKISIEPSFQASPDTGTKITTTVSVDCAEVSWLPPTFFAGARISATATMARE